MVKKPQFIKSQWHLNELDARYAWKKNITGKDVTVCVVDNGVYYNPDLNIKETKVNPIIKNPELLNSSVYSHGTSVAGIIAAKGNKYVVGLSYDCKLVAYNFLGNLGIDEKYPLANFILKKNQKIDIFNNSWLPLITNSPNTTSEESLDVIKAIEISAKIGRKNKGNIFVFSSGNENLVGGLSSYVLLINNRFTIAVGAVNRNLDWSSYSNVGLAVLCVAPAGGDKRFLHKDINTLVYASIDQFGITTTLPNTKNLSQKGYIPYTHDFNGTSAACPMVTGCIALLLSYKPDLTWRDIKELISRSCYQDYYINESMPQNEFILNGRGQIISQRTGYGIINIKKLIKNARKWSLLPTEKYITQRQNINTILNIDNPTYTSTFNIDKKIIIETVQIYLTINSKPSIIPELILNLSVVIVSPTGTRLTLINNQAPFITTPDFKIPEGLQYYDNQPFLCELLRGEPSNGIWTIEFKWNLIPLLPDAINILKNARIDIFGHKSNKNNCFNN